MPFPWAAVLLAATQPFAAVPVNAATTNPGARFAEAPAVNIMLRRPPRGADSRVWRNAFTARAPLAGLTIRDTLSLPGVPWTLRVVRASIDSLLLANLGEPEPAGSRFAGAPHALARFVRRIEADPAVAWAEPDYARPPAQWVDDALPPEPLLIDSRQWGLHNIGPGGAYGGVARADIHAPEAWRHAGTVAAPVRLAIADTGIDPTHPEFASPRAGGSRIVMARALAAPHEGIHDSLGHGTMVAGIVAASIGEGAHFDSLGMAGVCGHCDLMPIRITRGARSTASSFDIALAVLHATDADARALNLSFAGGGRSRLERLALTHAIARGTVVVAASGNRGFNDPAALMYPAAYAADGLCIAVGASDSFDRRALFSSYGPHLDLVAPGLNIWSTWMTYPAAGGAAYPGYVAGSGTSFAAPFATGTIGLLAGARPELAAGDYQPLLRATADDVAAAGLDAETGAGRLNAAAAMEAISPRVAIWHDEVAAEPWREDATGPLTLGEDGPGSFTARWSGRHATRVVFRAHVALPDSFADSASVWPRITATTTLGANFTQPYYAPWCEARLEGRTITLRGFAYRLAEDDGAGTTPEDDRWIPLPPDQMRFGFTVIGAARRTPAVSPRHADTMLRMHPNPSHGTVLIQAPASGHIAVFDVRGRVVWRGTHSDGPGMIEWPGADLQGRRAPPGLYLVAFEGGGERRTGRLVRLD